MSKPGNIPQVLIQQIFMDGINWIEAHFGEQLVMPQHDFDNGIT